MLLEVAGAEEIFLPRSPENLRSRGERACQNEVFQIDPSLLPPEVKVSYSGDGRDEMFQRDEPPV